MNATKNTLRTTGIASTGTLMIVVAMFMMTGTLNPDWFSYAAIYANGGAWLQASGRDPLFVILITGAEELLGEANYDQFRFLVGVYFSAFTFALLRGWIVPYQVVHARTLIILLSLLPLVTPRFTVQIREGLATTLVIVAIGCLWRHTGKIRPRWLLTLTLFVVACLVHGGLITLLLALLLGLVVIRVAQGSIRREQFLMFALSVLSTTVMCAVCAYLLATPFGAALIDKTFGWMVTSASAMTLAKSAYWLAIGMGAALVASRVWALNTKVGLSPALRGFIGIQAIVLVPAIYFGAITLLFLGAPPIMVSALSRVMNLLLALLLLVLMFAGRMSNTLALFAVLVFVDQIRIIVEAIGTTVTSVY